MRARLFFFALAFVVVLRKSVVYNVMQFTQTAVNASFVSKVNNSVAISGDVILGGLFTIHRSENGQLCDKWSSLTNIQLVEAMLYAIDKINQNTTVLPNITLGADIRDDCFSETVALEESLNFVLRAFTQYEHICLAPGQTQARVVGVVGTGSSTTSLSVASLLRLFHLPQVSYAATSPDLSNRNDYGYFTRTVPSDDCQAEALIDVIDCLNWTAVYLISTSGNYGQRIKEAFIRVAQNRSVCIVGKMEIRAITNDSIDALDKFLSKINKSAIAVRGVVLLTEQRDIRIIFQRINSTNIPHDRFVWLGTETWGTELSFLRGFETIADGAITITLHTASAETSQDFYQYFDELRPDNYSRNPWFNYFYKTHTSGRMINDRVPYVIDAVYALAYSLDHMLRNSCSSEDLRECLRHPIGGHDLLDYLLQINFTGVSGTVNFDNHGNGVSRYNIMHYVNGTYQKIADWNRGQSLSHNLEGFYKQKKGHMLNSDCTLECGIGEARTRYPNVPSCCWGCKKCPKSQYVNSEQQCRSCGDGNRTNRNKTGCERLPEGYISLIIVIILAFWASLGFILDGFVAYTVFKYYSTPIIMASGRELMLVLLFGIGMCHSLGFLLLAVPNSRRCAYQRFGSGVSLCICYSAVLVKTNRIARIFRGNHRPAFITPGPQLFITALFVSVQLGVCFVMFNVGASLEVTLYHTADHAYSICRTSGMEYLVSISYNILLMLLCTCYAFLTRKLPANFNEARKVGLTMYTTCVLWIIFLPLFYGGRPENQTAVLLLNSCLNATVLLIGLFGHKVYVVWFQPEKNTRRASNPRGRSVSIVSGLFHMDDRMDGDDTKYLGSFKSMSHFSSNVTLRSNISN